LSNPLTIATIPTSELVALLIATSFAAGLNVYATLVTLDYWPTPDCFRCLPRCNCIELVRDRGQRRDVVIEFFADKIPAFDCCGMRCTRSSVSHCALLAYGATATLSPGEQLVATIAGGAIALAAHGAKRLCVLR